MKGEFSTIIEKHGKWYIGYIAEIPGVNTQGKTIEEVKENLKEALIMVIESNRELAYKSIQSSEIIKGIISVEWT